MQQNLNSYINGFLKKASLVKPEFFIQLCDNIERQAQDSVKIINVKDKIIRIPYKKDRLLDLSQKLRTFTQDSKAISDNADTISFLFLTIVTDYDYLKNSISAFIDKHLGIAYFDLFEKACSLTEKTIISNQHLLDKGWTPSDINTFNFRAYQYLSGELESRYTQETTKLNDLLNQYFLLYTSETINPSEVNVYGEGVVFETGISSKYGLETTNDGKYVLHSAKTIGNAPFIIHELGHIVFDEVFPENKESFNAIKDFPESSLEEHFCESFVDYVARKEFNKELSDYIVSKNKTRNYVYFDNVFDSFFNPQNKIVKDNDMVEMISFVNKVLEI